jgi:hypothetical protein
MTRHERVLLTMAEARGGLAGRLAARHLGRCAACRRAVAAFDEVDRFAAELAAALVPTDRPAWEPALRAVVVKPSASRTDPTLRPVRAAAPAVPVPPARPARRPARLLPAAVALAVLAALVVPALWLRALQRDDAPPVDHPPPPTPTTTLAPTPARKAAAERAARALVEALKRGDASAVWTLLAPGVRATDQTPARALARLRAGMLGHVPPDAAFTAVRIPSGDGVLRWAVLARSPSGTTTGVLVVAVTSLAARAVIDEADRHATGLADDPEWLPNLGVMKSPARISWRVVPANAVQLGQPDKPIALATADVRAAWIVVDTRAMAATVTLSATLWELSNCCQTLQATASGIPRLAAGQHTVALVLLDRLGRVQTSAVRVTIE